MKNQSLLYGIIGLLLGAVIVLVTAKNAVNSNNTGMMRMMGLQSQNQFSCPMVQEKEGFGQGMGMKSSMNEMMESMQDKSGDDFDKAFIEAMIVHHQGAIDMANSAKQNAKHEEIQNLSEDIISAQSKEIEMMNNWKNQWNY